MSRKLKRPDLSPTHIENMTSEEYEEFSRKSTFRMVVVIFVVAFLVFSCKEMLFDDGPSYMGGDYGPSDGLLPNR